MKTCWASESPFAVITDKTPWIEIVGVVGHLRSVSLETDLHRRATGIIYRRSSGTDLGMRRGRRTGPDMDGWPRVEDSIVRSGKRRRGRAGVCARIAARYRLAGLTRAGSEVVLWFGYLMADSNQFRDRRSGGSA